MPDALLISNLLLWCLVVGLAAAVVALARQVGVLHERIAPAGALSLQGGLEVGERAPELVLPTLAGDDIRVGGTSADHRSTLLFFLSPTCPVCDTLLPILRSVAKSERGWLQVVLASDGEPAEHRSFSERQELQAFPYVLSRDLGMRFHVAKLPYAALIDEGGVLRAKGLINSREHLESLFEAMERGVASVSEYLSERDDLRVA